MMTAEKDQSDELETVTAAKRVIVSYDVRRTRRVECTLVSYFVFGRDVRVRTAKGLKRYHYTGLIARPGVERVGQSVFMMKEKDAEDFTHFLGKLRVPNMAEQVWVRA